MYFLQESDRKSISCKNLARFLQQIFFLSGSCKKCIFCQNLTRVAFFVKILQESCKNCICFQPGQCQFKILDEKFKIIQKICVFTNTVQMNIVPFEILCNVAQNSIKSFFAIKRKFKYFNAAAKNTVNSNLIFTKMELRKHL